MKRNEAGPSQMSNDAKRLKLRNQRKNDRSMAQPLTQRPVKLTSNKAAGTSPQSRLKARSAHLNGSKFRFLNETLYTSTSQDSLDLFRKHPDNFTVYHQGFQAQVSKWPVNPVDFLISYVRRHSQSIVIADFGCGEAKLAKSVPNKVYSFDLVAQDERVIACDIANVPLADHSIKLAIFCLSLMGTNWPDFIREANRVLTNGGILKIVEVRSRIPNIDGFVKMICSFGFKSQDMDKTNVMFVAFTLVKVCRSAQAIPGLTQANLVLKPCLYKKR